MAQKIRFIIVGLLLILTLSGCGKIKDFFSKIGGGKFPTQKLIVETDFGKHELTVEVADEPEERRKGYMFRTKIGENEGMWFIFENEVMQKFWMRNTKVALDMLYVNKDLEIHGMTKNTEPCKKDPCATYDSPPKTKYVLEVPAGFADTKNVEIGDRILFPKN